jgi:hypothetical protein
MLIRHAEKPEKKRQPGIDEDGSENKRSISVRGWQRAGALIGFFAHPAHLLIAKPDLIFAAATTDDPSVSKDDAKSLRPPQTVAPLSAKLGLATNTEYAVGNEKALIAALQKAQGIVLVAWEHKRIPVIAGAFAAVPPAWNFDIFHDVWVLDRRADGAYDFSIVNQNLLAGDTS